MEGQNLALNKSYTLSELPNYAYSAPPTDKTSLTDGIYTTGHFWTRPTTVGWLRRQVTIAIDLGSVLPIEEVTFNSARKTDVGVDYPKNIYVFISDDDREYRYVGDAADIPDNLPGPYQVKKFILNNINSAARYVALAIVQQGKMSFCDEIEVLKSDKVGTIKGSDLISKNRLGTAVDSLQGIEYDRNNLERIAKKVQKTSQDSPGANQNSFSAIKSKLSIKNISKNDLDEIRKTIGKAHSSILRINHEVPFIVEKFNPWDSLSEIHEPKEDPSVLDYQFLVLKNGVQYGAFIITNSNLSSQKFSFKISNPDASVSSLELFNVPFVPSSNFIRVCDPLVLLNSEVSIDPGFSEMFLFKMTGMKNGIAKSIISIQSGNQSVTVNISTSVLNVPAYNGMDDLNANVWAYLNYPMVKDRQGEAAKDLDMHHINSIVVPPAFIPIPGNLDFSKLINYLTPLKHVKNIFLFTNYAAKGYRNVNKNIEYLSTEWKNDFVKWYNEMLRALKSSGISSEIYLYPYDEVGGKDIQDFKNLATWAKTALPQIKLYATLTRKETLDNIISLIDIAQISNYPDLLSELPVHSCEIWSYSGGSPSKSLSPYKFYRLMAWKAFVNDVKGIGFWAYADEGKNRVLNLISDPLTNPSSSYSVIYDGPGSSIISSRRWEAFRLGIEDYKILKLYAKKAGIQKAKLLANEVLSDPSDINKADSIRSQILENLN